MGLPNTCSTSASGCAACSRSPLLRVSVAKPGNTLTRANVLPKGLVRSSVSALPVSCQAKPPCTASCLPPKRSEEHTSELQSLMRISYAVFCLKKKNKTQKDATDLTKDTIQHIIQHK